MNNFYSSITKNLTLGASRAGLGLLSFRSDSLREYLRSIWEGAPGSENAFLSDIIFESTFNWSSSKKTFGSLSGNLLNSELVNAMRNPLKNMKKEYTFPARQRPYKHQLESWKQLIEKTPARSVLVSSGTGSGKTECFLVPILNDLANESSKQPGQLVGTRAIFLYPLNALIKSQRDRLVAWAEPFDGRIRFCLFNGDTPNEAKKSDLKCEVIDRKTLRTSPPPILVTNSTMLEYMLVRNEDRPIIDKSYGKLRWIVIDEAHTYIGSQAADLTLLIRRVLHAFACNIDEVHFVATSATIAKAGEKNTKYLREFIADIAGVHPDRISIIIGHREVPQLINPQNNKSIKKLPDVNSLKELTPDQLYEKLSSYAPLQKIRKTLIQQAKPLSEISKSLIGKYNKNSMNQALYWLDLCSQAINNKKEPFLPLRGHIFQRSINGIWACVNSKCTGIQGTKLSSPDWSYGKIFLGRRLYCDSCKSSVYEMVQCYVCGSSYLLASEKVDKKDSHLEQYKYDQDEDEFQQELEPLDEEELNDNLENDSFHELRRLLVSPNDNAAKFYLLNNSKLNFNSNEGIPIYIKVPDSDNRLSCPCCNTHEQNIILFRPIRIGAPFLLQTAIPILLSHMPVFREKNTNLPHKGRRILSFTDSRQGTARFSTKLQLETERNFVRSILYHSVHDRAKPVDQSEIDKINDEIKALEQVKTDNPAIKNMIKDKKQKLNRLNLPILGRLTWNNAIDRLLTDDSFKRWLLPPLREQTYGFNDRQLAELCLWREFLRRPRRQFSLEVFGLLRLGYPGLEKINISPNVAIQNNISIEEWRNLAHIFIDYQIRAYMSVAISKDIQRWIGYPGRPSFIIGPNQEKIDGVQNRWPSTRTPITRRSRLIRHIAFALNLNIEEKSHQSIIEQLLIELWSVICPILSGTEKGYHLELSQQVDIVQVRSAWLCPVTRRLLPITFKSITPYLPLNPTHSLAKCQKVDMPCLPNPFWLERDNNPSQKWIESNTNIKKLRELGVWTDLCDRIASFSKYFYSTEHSAQISGSILTNREKRFKEGKINLLSCSTTMEMGVDIGGLSTIAMNNVPPHPANFLQRAGRAGRRNETKALSFTLCKSTPHGESVFQNPMWPFSTELAVPQVSLQSQPIVHRHINSLILSVFLNKVAPEDIWRLYTGWFFVSDSEDQSPPCMRFYNWCQTEAINEKQLQDGINNIIKRTVLAGVPVKKLIFETQNMIKEMIDRWKVEYNILCENLELVKTPRGDSKAEKAIEIQIKRMTKEYLLRELANQNFIPIYGFASGLACLVTTTIEQIKFKQEFKSREDNKAIRAGYPSRPLAVAIRDYAPGTDTVLDGRVYRSSGLTLNWQLPAELEGPPEIQYLRWVWQCKTCGNNGTRNSFPTNCPHCKERNSKQLIRHEYIQPSGFAVDIRCKPHNDISIPQYLPVRDPFISLEGSDWLSLPSSFLGRYRFSTNGALFYRTDGLNGEGYALCLRCGRSDSMISEDQLPAIFADKHGHTKPHKRLRGGKNNDQEYECPGSHEEWAIKRNLRIGVNIYTDVLEIQLNQLNGNPIDREIAYSLGVALRLALARKLGIDDQEIGSVVKSSRNENEQSTWSINLFDTTQGGAGYVMHALKELPSIIRRAKRILSCPKNCDSACQACLMDFNTQYHLDWLDRVRTLELLSETYLKAFDLPEHLKVLGPDAKLEMEPLSMAIYREFQRINAKEISIYLCGNEKNWELLDWWMYHELLTISETGCKIHLIMTKNIQKKLEASQKDELYVIMASTRAELYSTSLNTMTINSKSQQYPKIIEISSNQDLVQWYATQMDALNPGSKWGSGINGAQYVRIKARQSLKPVPKSWKIVNPDILKNAGDNNYTEISITNELNGSIKQFGKKAWKLICLKSQKLGKQIKKSEPLEQIIYTDRYLRSPLVLVLLKMFLKELHTLCKGMKTNPQLEINTTELEIRNYRRSPYLISHDWCDAEERKDIFESVLTFHKKPVINEKRRREIPHARELCLIWPNDTHYIIRFDQGMGYWQAYQQSFPFDHPLTKQIEFFEKEDFHIFANSNSYSTHWYVK